MIFITMTSFCMMAAAASSSFFPQRQSFGQHATFDSNQRYSSYYFAQSPSTGTFARPAASWTTSVQQPASVLASSVQPLSQQLTQFAQVTAAQPSPLSTTHEWSNQPSTEANTWEENAWASAEPVARATAPAQSFMQAFPAEQASPIGQVFGQSTPALFPAEQAASIGQVFGQSTPASGAPVAIAEPTLLTSSTVGQQASEEALVQSLAQQPVFEQVDADETAKAFPQDSVRKYNIEISAVDASVLNADISAEKYVPCSITTDYGTAFAVTYDGCGCRYKGAVGSLLSCIDAGTGRPNGKCRKFSLKVDANEYRNDKQKIDGNKKLMFHGMAVDKSLVSERLAYNAMQDLGLPASRAAHAELFVNGNYDGVYTVVEEIEKVLTKRYFSEDYNDGKGALYKDVWFDGALTEEYLEEAFKSGRRDHEFMQQVAAIVPYINDCGTLESFFDLGSIVDVTAFNNMIGVFDDWRYKHNFYWYVREDSSGKKLVMIPWDYDRVDAKNNKVDGRHRKHALAWTDPQPDAYTCANFGLPHGDPKTSFGFNKVFNERAAQNFPKDFLKPINCYHLTQMFAKCMAEDTKAKSTEFSAQLSPSTLSLRIDEYADQIAGSVARDSSITQSEWKTAISSLKNHIASSAARASTPDSRITASLPSSGSTHFSLNNAGSVHAFRSFRSAFQRFGS